MAADFTLITRSVADDDALLQDASLPRNIQNCIKVRRCEKEVLMYYVNLADFLERVLCPSRTCGQARELFDAAVELKEEPNLAYYVRNVILPLLGSVNDSIEYLETQFAHMNVGMKEVL